MIEVADEGPERRCCGCRATLRVDEGLRWVAAPDGTVAFDARRRMGGRGAHTCARRRCLTQAIKRRAFDRALGVTAHSVADAEMWANALAALNRQVRELLGLIRRSGDLEIGARAVRQGLHTKNFALVVVALDHSERSAADFQAVSLRWGTSEVIGRAIGRKPTGVVAAPAGALTDALASALRRCNTLAGDAPVERGVSL